MTVLSYQKHSEYNETSETNLLTSEKRRYLSAVVSDRGLKVTDSETITRKFTCAPYLLATTIDMDGWRAWALFASSGWASVSALTA